MKVNTDICSFASSVFSWPPIFDIARVSFRSFSSAVLFTSRRFFTIFFWRQVSRSLRGIAKANVLCCFPVRSTARSKKRKLKNKEREREEQKCANAPADGGNKAFRMVEGRIIFVPSATVFREDNAPWVPQSRMQPTQKTRLGLLYCDSLLSTRLSVSTSPDLYFRLLAITWKSQRV